MMQVNIPEDAPLGQISFSTAVTSDQARKIMPVGITVVSELNLDFTVLVEDEFTYFAEGNPKVANATVRIVNIPRGIDQSLDTQNFVRKSIMSPQFLFLVLL